MRVITAIALIALGAGGYHMIGKQAVTQATAPAQQQVAQAAHVITQNVVAEGRIAAYPGAEVLVASEKPGIIGTMYVREQDIVRKGHVLGELRNAELLAAQEEARARVREAEADILLAGTENSRTSDLVRRQFISRQALDKTERDVSAAQARLASAQAVLKRIAAQIEKTRIIAPIAGTIVMRHVDDGEAVAEGGPVATIANLNRLRVEAEVDEFDIGRIHPGDAVTISAEGYDGKHWQGHVEEIPDTVRERGLRPQDVARPTDARILLVKVAMQELVPLRLGQRVEVSIATRASAVANSGREKTTVKVM